MSQPQTIPMLDLQAEVEELWDKIEPALRRVLKSGRFILGPEVEAFEKEAAAYLGVDNAVGLNSGTDALVIALRALGIGPGDEVITTAFSFFATAEAIASVGATPVFADIDAESFNLDPEDIENRITSRTRAVMPVHLYGRPAAMAAIIEVADRHGLKVVEDCAQSFGARYASDDDPKDRAAGRGMRAVLDGKLTGSLGKVAAFSFYPTKNLGAYGDGGLLTTDDDAIAEQARMLRNHGESRRYDSVTLGYNSRLDALQAAILRVKLTALDKQNEARRNCAAVYQDLLDSAGIVLPRLSRGHIFHQYTIRLHDSHRTAVKKALAERGITTSIYYPKLLDRMAPFDDGKPSGLPAAETAAKEVLSLPMHPYLAKETQARIADEICKLLPSEVFGIA